MSGPFTPPTSKPIVDASFFSAARANKDVTFKGHDDNGTQVAKINAFQERFKFEEAIKADMEAEHFAGVQGHTLTF